MYIRKNVSLEQNPLTKMLYIETYESGQKKTIWDGKEILKEVEKLLKEKKQLKEV